MEKTVPTELIEQVVRCLDEICLDYVRDNAYNMQQIYGNYRSYAPTIEIANAEVQQIETLITELRNYLT